MCIYIHEIFEIPDPCLFIDDTSLLDLIISISKFQISPNIFSNQKMAVQDFYPVFFSVRIRFTEVTCILKNPTELVNDFTKIFSFTQAADLVYLLLLLHPIFHGLLKFFQYFSKNQLTNCQTSFENISNQLTCVIVSAVYILHKSNATALTTSSTIIRVFTP